MAPPALRGGHAQNRRKRPSCRADLVAPFVAIYALVFVYPTLQMFRISFTDAPLIGEGNWVGFDNYARLASDPISGERSGTRLLRAVTVVPGTLVAMLIALGVSRLTDGSKRFVLALFFLPYILPVSVVYLHLGLDAELPVWHRHARPRLAGHPAGSRFQIARRGSCRPLPGSLFGGRPAFRCCFSSLALRAFPLNSMKQPRSTMRPVARLSGGSLGRCYGRSAPWYSPSNSFCSSRFSTRFICSRSAAVRTTTWCWSIMCSSAPSSKTRAAGPPRPRSLFLLVVVVSVLQFQLLRFAERTAPMNVKNTDAGTSGVVSLPL